MAIDSLHERFDGAGVTILKRDFYTASQELAHAGQQYDLILADLGVSSPHLNEGKRGFAITATEVQNAGGLVLPGDYVDFVVLHDVEFLNDPADPSSRETVASFLVQTLMQNVEVLAVAQTVVDVVEVPVETEEGAVGATGAQPSAAPAEGEDLEEGSTQRVRNSEAAPLPGAATITIAVTPEEAERLYLAEANGTVRLTVRPFGDDETVPVDYQTKIELIPQDVPNPFQSLR